MEKIIKDKVNGKDGVYLPQLKGSLILMIPYGTYQLRLVGHTSLERED